MRSIQGGHGAKHERDNSVTLPHPDAFRVCPSP
jgi:hypothetical protein